MHEPNPILHVLIDFENVPHTTLDALAGLEVEITLLLGEKNKRLDVNLVEGLLAAGPRAQVIRVGATGRNALDLTLAFYLGRAAMASPRAHFFIVSKDADYDPMIRHARRTGLSVERHDSVDTLPFIPKPAAATPAPAPVAPTRPRPHASAHPAPARTLDAGAAEIADHLRDYPKMRPTTQTRLRGLIRSRLPKGTADDRINTIIAQLQAAGHLSISERNRVTYA